MAKLRARRRLRGIPNSVEFEESLYTMVGHSVVAFGVLDFAIDMLVGMLFRDFGGQAIKKKIPVPFSDRLDFIKDCADAIGDLKPFSDQLHMIAREADRVAQVRNDVIHGYPANYRKRGHRFTFAKAQVDKQRRSIQLVKLRDITAKELMKVWSEPGGSLQVFHSARFKGRT